MSYFLFFACSLWLFSMLSLVVVIMFSLLMQRIVAMESKLQKSKRNELLLPIGTDIDLFDIKPVDIDPIDIVRMQQTNESTKRKNADAKISESSHSWYENYIRDIGTSE